MYVPAQFRESDAAALYEFIERNSFGVLVTRHGEEPYASHLPFLLDRESGELLAHVARANPQAQDFGSASNALVIFHGPHAYVSPSWYVEPDNVPTWNYTAVHVYGKIEIADRSEDSLAILRRLVELQERAFQEPWRMDESSGYTQALLSGIVAFRLKIERIEGKFKLSQNRSAQDRESARSVLAASGREMDRDVAALMKAKG